METLSLLALFSISCLLSWLLATPIKKLCMSATIVELAVGFVLGNWVVSFEEAKAVSSIAEIGALALFFLVGLHTDISEAKIFRRDITTVVLIGAIAPPLIMLGLYEPLGLTPAEALFAVATLMATGVGTVMRVLQEYQQTGTMSGRFLLACSVIEDIPAILLLSFAASFAKYGALNQQMLLGLMPLFGAGILCVIIAKLPVTKKIIFGHPLPLALTLPAIIIAAWLTNLLGITSLFGAFLVGLLCKYNSKSNYQDYTRPIIDFFIPNFFIMAGMRIKCATLMQAESWELAGALMAIAFASKLLCFIGIRKETKASGIDPWTVAFGMIPRGLPGLVFAMVALNSGLISDRLFASLVIMVTFSNTMGLSLLTFRLKRNSTLPDKT